MSELERYRRLGWAVVEGAVPREECHLLAKQHQRWQRVAASDLGLTASEVASRLAQARDLWRRSPAFDALMRGRLGELAMAFLEASGAQLLHDHLITKPAGRSNEVPWHQDFPYWPVDRSGLSIWLALDDAPLDGGCLQVIESSHLEGERGPVDFARGDAPPRDAMRARPIPVRQGDVVVLDGLTWHRSGPNENEGQRAAYITLWLPPDATYAPTHAPWHPVNAHASADPGQPLGEDGFPRVGHAMLATPREASTHVVPTAGLSMFTASNTIRAQLAGLVPRHEGTTLEELASTHAGAVVEALRRAGHLDPDDEPSVREALAGLAVGARAMRQHGARDVYLSAHRSWWRLVGATLEAHGT